MIKVGSHSTSVPGLLCQLQKIMWVTHDGRMLLFTGDLCIIKENSCFFKNITNSYTDTCCLSKGTYLSPWVLRSSLLPQTLLLSSENNIFRAKAIWVQLETVIQQQKTLTAEKRIVNNGLIFWGSWNFSCWKRETFYSINFYHLLFS